MMDNEFPGKEIGELLEEVSIKVPKLINNIFGSFYTEETGKNIGQAVGSFYKELVESGIPAEDALKMTKDYMISLKNMSGQFANLHDHQEHKEG